MMKWLACLLFVCAPAFATICAGTGLCIVTVKPSGGDYATIATAITGEATNLVTANRIVEIDLYAMTDAYTGTPPNVTGYTTDSTHYVKLFVPLTERHVGVWNSAKYNLTNNANFQNSLIVSNNFTQVIGIQCKALNNNGTCIAVTGNSVLVDSVIVAKVGTGSTSCGVTLGGSSNVLRNSIIYGVGGGSGECNGNFATVEIDNCTIVGSALFGVDGAAHDATIVVKNTYAGNNTSGDYATSLGSATTFTKTTSASADSSGTGGLTSIAVSTSTGAKFTNITATTENFHINTGSSLVDVGTSLSGSFTVDIDNDTRSGTWDIGADEIVTGGAAAVVRRRLIQ